VTTYTYDNRLRLTKTIRNKVTGSSGPDINLTTETFYDSQGRATATIDERGIVTRTIFDAKGRVEKTIVNCTDAGTTPSSSPAACVGGGTHDGKTNIVTQFAYDALGNLTSETRKGPSGTANDAVTEHEYDSLGRRYHTVVDPSGLSLDTWYAYDDFGNQIARKDPRGTVTRSWFDKAGNVTKTVANCTTSGTTILSSSTFGTCTGAGTADANWNVETTYAYDTLGRQTSVTARSPPRSTTGPTGPRRSSTTTSRARRATRTSRRPTPTTPPAGRSRSARRRPTGRPSG
jgi:YD repeat-containing protein